MRSNYKRIGDCIKLVDERNVDLKVTELIGISISKEVIPSVANTVGTDMSKYKIIRKNQFACSTMQVRRDKKMPVAILKEFDEAIISAAYPVFEVINEKIILPDYLMMWFSRTEFDREACFYAIGGVRGSIEWEDFCNMKLPVPSIEKQMEIVKEYKILQNRVNLNNSLIEKLEDMANTIYKQWFVDFDFPDKDGNPYKTSGGNMEYDKKNEMEIPCDWKCIVASKYYDISIGNTPSRENMEYFSKNNTGIKWVSIADLKNSHFIFNTKECLTKVAMENCKVKVIPSGTVIMSFKLTVGKVAIINEDMATNEAIAHFKIDDEKILNYTYYMLKNYDFNNLGSTSSIGNAINSTIVKNMSIIIPSKEIILAFDNTINKITRKIKNLEKMNMYLIDINSILLSKLATVEG